MTLAVSAMTGGFSTTPMSQGQGAGKGVGRNSQAGQELAFPLSESSGSWTLQFDSHFLGLLCVILHSVDWKSKTNLFASTQDHTEHRLRKPFSGPLRPPAHRWNAGLRETGKANEALALVFGPRGYQADGKIQPAGAVSRDF